MCIVRISTFLAAHVYILGEKGMCLSKPTLPLPLPAGVTFPAPLITLSVSLYHNSPLSISSLGQELLANKDGALIYIFFNPQCLTYRCLKKVVQMIEWADENRNLRKILISRYIIKSPLFVTPSFDFICLIFSLVKSCFQLSNHADLAILLKTQTTYPFPFWYILIHICAGERMFILEENLTCSNEADYLRAGSSHPRILPVTQCVSVKALASWWARFWKSSKL